MSNKSVTPKSFIKSILLLFGGFLLAYALLFTIARSPSIKGYNP